MSFCSKESFSPHIYVVLEIRISTNCNCGQKNVKTQFFAIFESGNLNILGLVLGFLTESNKPYSVNGVTGPILKNTTKVTWAGRESKSPSQRAPVGDPVKRGGRGGKVIQNKRRVKNDVATRVHWTLNTAHQFIIIDHLYQDT
jgi:hypothetical protein